MQRQDFHFDLPEKLIAQYPAKHRGDSRLLCVEPATGVINDRMFRQLPDLLRQDDLLVFNNTRVIPARLYARKETGGRCEILVERLIDDKTVLAHVKASKSPRPDSQLILEDNTHVTVLGRQGDLFQLGFEGAATVMTVLEAVGHMPLPPYIQRQDEQQDQERYQTVYSSVPGAVAAPTAGLHFEQSMLDELRQQGIDMAYVTLHVGAGTFQPVRVDDINEHHMHSEWLEVTEQVCAKIKQAQEAGGRVIAVGTTAVRALESASPMGQITPFSGDTDIFIYPGYRFRTVDAMITNFHLPESTLLMLVSAFAGYELTFKAYRHAVEQGYRFFSYGDAMFISGRAEGLG